MKKFEVILAVNNADAVLAKLQTATNINTHAVQGEEAAIEKMQQQDTDIIIYEGGADFGQRNKLKSMQKILRPNAEIIEYDARNINALPDDLEMAMQKVNARNTSGNQYFDGL